jgi:hypothetical protein
MPKQKNGKQYWPDKLKSPENSRDFKNLVGVRGLPVLNGQLDFT